MVLTFTVASPEVDDFVLELKLNSDATFRDLHDLIRETCGWGRHKESAFYVCDHRWHPERTIREHGLEDDTMDDVELGDVLDDEGQRMQYVFDEAAERGLLMELSHIAYGQSIALPHCSRRHGEAPALIIETPAKPAPLTQEQLLAALQAAQADNDDDMEPADDDLFDMSELDMEGFDFSEQ